MIVLAYDDAAGVTAAFNRNVLAVVNRELHADFDLGAFAHDASWNPALERVEIRLRSRRAQIVRIASLGMEVTFQAGESILTEISRRFRREVIARAAQRAGLRRARGTRTRTAGTACRCCRRRVSSGDRAVTGG